MVEKQIFSQKETIAKKMIRRAKKWAAIGLIGTAGLMPLASKGQNEKFASFTPKIEVRVYKSGQDAGFGAGFDISKDIGKASIGATGTLGFADKKLLVDEASGWVGVPVGKVLYVVGYIYADQFYAVDIKHPAYGINFKHKFDGIALKSGFERGIDFSCQYDKIVFPDGMTLGVTTLFWGDKIGYDAAIGRLQMAGGCVGIDSKVLNRKFHTEILYLKSTHGSAGTVRVRCVLSL